MSDRLRHERPTLTREEIAVGWVFGAFPQTPELPDTPASLEPSRALELAILPTLQRPPCAVSFSGGRDSSVILAAAASVARKEGLPLPVPITQRFPRHTSAEESSWQELVIRHLVLPDWERHVIEDDSLDVIGAVSGDAMRRCGLLWPANAYMHAPILAAAKGGTVLTGMDGDGLFGRRRWTRAAHVLYARARPRIRDMPNLAHALAPGGLRARWARFREPQTIPWLVPRLQNAADRAFAVEKSGEPVRWDSRVRWWSRRRHLAVARRSYDRLAAAFQARVYHPFLNPTFLASLARTGARAGFEDRVGAMNALFGDLLPASVLSRRDKTHLNRVFWGEESRRFISTWDGRGVPEDLVDSTVLRKEWMSSAPHPWSATLLQDAWLESSGSDQAPDLLEQPGRR